MNDKPLFSVIIATKDRPSDLERTLTSFKKCNVLQRKDTEVIIVDNRSSNDEVKTVCRKFEVKYVLEEKRGKAFALNKGISISRGEYCVFTDDDVILQDPCWLDNLHRHFKEYKQLGYVSGNIVAFKLNSLPQIIWEEKGGLSKGNTPKYFSHDFLKTFRWKPWPLTKICAGANCMIPKKILDEIGGYCTLFGPGASIGHGESLEVGYRIIRAGYELYYDPEATIHHHHPEEASSIKRKLFLYATGDTGIHAYIFLKWRDWRSFLWAFSGHQFYIFGNMIKRMRRQYPLPLHYLIYSLAGSSIGGLLLLYRYFGNYKNKDKRI